MTNARSLPVEGKIIPGSEVPAGETAMFIQTLVNERFTQLDSTHHAGSGCLNDEKYD